MNNLLFSPESNITIRKLLHAAPFKSVLLPGFIYIALSSSSIKVAESEEVHRQLRDRLRGIQFALVRVAFIVAFTRFLGGSAFDEF